MKKFSKMLALGMALSLAFGVTAFAADSVTVATSKLEKVEVPEGSLEAGEQVVAADMTTEDEASAAAEINKPETVAAISKVLNIASDKKATLKLATTFEIEVQDAGGNVVKDKGITLTFKWAGFDVNKKYVVLHYNGTKWEVISGTVTPDGVQASFTSLSPVAIVEVGEEAVPNPTTPDTDTPSETPRSPQTGEVLPVAGIMALICLAGAAVCFGKVRYNKQ